jgi:hypothetical protein
MASAPTLKENWLLEETICLLVSGGASNRVRVCSESELEVSGFHKRYSLSNMIQLLLSKGRTTFILHLHTCCCLLRFHAPLESDTDYDPTGESGQRCLLLIACHLRKTALVLSRSAFPVHHVVQACLSSKFVRPSCFECSGRHFRCSRS